MALMIFFLVIFSCTLALFNYKNKYSMLWAVMSFAIALCTVTLSMEIQRVSNYSIASNYFFGRLDAQLFFRLNELKPLPLSSLLVLRNFAYSLFQVTNLAFLPLFGKYKKHGVTGGDALKRWSILVSAVYVLLHFAFYHPEVGYRIFLLQFNLAPSAGRMLLLISRGLHAALTIGTYLCPLLPILYLFYCYQKKYLTIFLEQLLSRMIILMAFHMLFFVVISEPAAMKWSELMRTGFWRGINRSLIPEYNISLLPWISFCVLILIGFLLVRFQTANFIDYFKEHSIKKQLHNLHDNLRDVLHSEKNVIFNFKILAEAAIHDYGSPQGRQKLERLITLSSSHLESLTQSINNIRDFKINTIKKDFTEAIEAALRAYPLPVDIKLVKNYQTNCAFCNYDLYHMTQIIINLLNNAVDAVKEQEDKRIELTLETSDYWVLFSIHDNGCGITRRNIRKIQKPYFSTKSKQNNWGIGLFYVQRVVKAHLGSMKIYSQPKAGTRVELLFMCVSKW